MQLVRAALMDTGRLKAHGSLDPRTWAALRPPGTASPPTLSHPRARRRRRRVAGPVGGARVRPAAGEREPDEPCAVASGATRFVPNLRLGNPACYVDLGSAKRVMPHKRPKGADAFRPAMSVSSRLEAYAVRRDAEARARARARARAGLVPGRRTERRPRAVRLLRALRRRGRVAYALRDVGGVPCSPPARPHARDDVINHGCGGGIFPNDDPNDAVTGDENENTAAYAGPLVVGDVTDVCESVIPNHDVLTGGFPCQAFSRRGDRRGFDDPRGLLYLEICRVLRACRPSAFLLENVDGLVTMRGGETIRAVTEALASCGYGVTYAVLDAADGPAAPAARVFRRVPGRQSLAGRARTLRVADSRRHRREPARALDPEREEDAADPPGAAMRACEISRTRWTARRDSSRAPELYRNRRRTHA